MSDVSDHVKAIAANSVAKLTEAGCESVIIIATIGEGSGTHRVKSSGGNYYAQLGSVRSWLAEQDESARVDVRPQE